MARQRETFGFERADLIVSCMFMGVAANMWMLDAAVKSPVRGKAR